MAIKAVIFDLDGVIVSTDEFHYQGWQRLADDEQIYFDRATNDRLRGVARVEALAILLERSARPYTEEEKRELAARKNGYYCKLIESLTPADVLARRRADAPRTARPGRQAGNGVVEQERGRDSRENRHGGRF